MKRDRSAVCVRRCALALLLASGCGAGIAPAFDLRFPDNDDARLERVRARLAAAKPPARAAGLLLATTHGAQPELLAYDLEQRRVRWRRAFRADSRPELLGDLVCSASGERLFGFDAQSGQPRFSAELRGCAYVGAARDAERVFFACQHAGSSSVDTRARLTALDARDGRMLWQRPASGLLGRPAAIAGLVFVPWQRQNLAVLDARDGEELARVRLSDDVVEWVSVSSRGVFFGQRSVHHIGATPGPLERSGQILIATEALPGRPPLIASAFEPQPGSRSARGRVALLVEPTLDAGALRIARDRYYLLFYRYAFAYDAAGALRWARMLPHDLIAANATAAGLLAVSERGQVVLLSSADGQPQVIAELGLPLAAARLGAPELAATQPTPAGSPLRRMLTEIALDTDNRLVPARAYAVAQLAAMPEPEVTRDLLDIYAQTTSAPELERVVADALRARRTGLEHLIEALLARYDFIEQTRPAPLPVIVPALVEARETRAVPHLVQRMFDHETPLPVLPAVVAAVATLGGASAVEPLLAFLRLYRADSSFAEQPQALLEAAKAVRAHGGEQAQAMLASVTADSRASPALANGIAALLAPVAGAAPEQAVARAAAPEPAAPEHLAQEAINTAFAAHIDDLRECVIDEVGRNPKLSQVRIAFIAESDGSAHAFSFVPNTPQFVDCLYPKVASYRYPRFRAGREVARYIVSVRTEEVAPAAAEPDLKRAEEPWWQWYAERPRAGAKAVGPWWQSRQPIAPLAITPTPGSAPTSAATPPSPAAGSPLTLPAPPTQPATPQPAPSQPAPPPSTAAPQPEAGPAQPAAPEDTWWVPAPPTR